jgi:hypothetical protein
MTIATQFVLLCRSQAAAWFAADSALEGDGFELPVREHHAMAPSHGFAAASHREAALRGAPASHGETAFRGAAGFREARRRHAVHPSAKCGAAVQAARYRAARRAAMRSAHCEIRPGENVMLQYLSHDGRPAPAVRAAATVRPATTAPFANGKIPVARPDRYSVEFCSVREENGNALPGDRARRSRPGAWQPLGAERRGLSRSPFDATDRHAGRRREMPDRGCGRRGAHGRRLEIRSGR